MFEKIPEMKQMIKKTTQQLNHHFFQDHLTWKYCKLQVSNKCNVYAGCLNVHAPFNQLSRQLIHIEGTTKWTFNEMKVRTLMELGAA